MGEMIVVIIAGGSGTRLWPLSTPNYPKQLLKINGDTESLLQHTYNRAKDLTNKIYVVSEVSHIDHVRNQLGDLPEEAFIVEPARRGTAHCILAALVHIAHSCDPDEPVAFVSADHYIRDNAGFMHSFKIATDVSGREKRIVLVGVEPDYPATGFGYIEKGGLLDEASFVYNVASFKEKPDHGTALSYVGSGNYLWNCGYFVGSINVFRDTMRQFAPDLYADYEKLAAAPADEFTAAYLDLGSVAIDYALIERTPNLLVAPASFDWMDVGSFADLHKAMGADAAGNSVHGNNIEIEEVANSLVHNQEDKPVAVIGLDNVVVVNTPQGVLVARKDLSQKVGDISKKFQQ